MREAGCHRIYFGLESGDDSILKIMMKDADVHSAENAVHAAHKAGLETGAFFIIGYPGESDQSILNTIRFATALPLDYSSFTLPYPIPGTGLYKKVKGHLKQSHKQRFKMIHQDLFFTSQFTEFKLKFGIVKAAIQFRIKHYLGEYGYTVLGKPFEKTTDVLFKALR